MCLLYNHYLKRYLKEKKIPIFSKNKLLSVEWMVAMHVKHITLSVYGYMIYNEYMYHYFKNILWSKLYHIGVYDMMWNTGNRNYKLLLIYYNF